ncbi:MAG: hypothetical protein ACI35Y_01415 [Candidatus Limimorpha sp.]
MKRKKILTFVTLIMLMSVLVASCSRAYQPTNYKKKNKKCDCSRWSQNNVENTSTISV